MIGKLSFLLTLIVLVCASCSSRYYIRRGNVIYETGRYYKAETKYDKAFNKARNPELRARAAMLAARCTEDVNKIADAHNWYRKAVQANKELPDPYLKMAEMNVRRGDFDAAFENYERFAELFPEDERAKDGRYYVELLMKDLSRETRYTVELQKDFNSRYGDFGPVFYPEDNNIVYFASSRPQEKRKGKRTDPVTGDAFCHIYVTEYTQEIKTVDKQGKVKVKRFPEPRWLKPAVLKDSLWSPKGEGGLCFSADGNDLYFTSSRIVEGRNRGTRIYKAQRTEDEKTGKKIWGKLSKSGICGDSVSVGHPAVTPDGSRIYFATDLLPGGKGGKDIWFAEWLDGKWGEPQNAGDLINTEKDEIYPYVRDNGELYFASNGHNGYGGLDIYRLKEVEGEQQLEHLPAPINSFADDFGITFRSGKEEGFFTSSRVGRNDKIYSFAYIPQQLRVKLLARNNTTDLPIPKVSVTVTCDDGSVVYLETDSTGMAQMEVLPQQEYVFAAENPRFLKGKGMVSTYREKGDRVFDVLIEMQPIEKPIVIPNIYFDLGKWELRQDAMDNLKELLTILKDNPNIAIELSAHTDMIGNDKANLELSEKRAQSVVDYLISKGVYWDRLEAKGYGETQPRQIDEKTAKTYSFLKVGDVLTERFVNRLRGQEREDALQLNRRIEFKVTRTNYKPGPDSRHNPYQVARTAEEVQKVGETRLKDLKSVKGAFFTLQLGVFKTVPRLIYNFPVVFTEKVNNGGVRYCTGIYDTREEAAAAAAALKKKGIDCFVRGYN